MQIAFYKGRKRLFNKLVSWWTRGPHSHVELVLDDGRCVSSSFQDGGFRVKFIDMMPEHWDLVDIGPQPADVEDRIAELFGAEFDVLGLVGFVFRRVSDDRGKLFCSETVARLIGLCDPWRFDPNTLYPVAVAISRRLNG
jgi:hypothetical protein